MKRWCRVGLVLLAALASIDILIDNAAYGLEINAQPVVQANWAEFSSDYDPQWSGETKRVDWRPNWNSGSGANITITNSILWGHEPAPPKPIELTFSNRLISFTAQANVLDVTAERQNSGSKQESGDYHWRTASYAEVLNLDDLFLAGAKAVAEQQSTLSDNSITAKGRVGTLASIHEWIGGGGKFVGVWPFASLRELSSQPTYAL